jgi:threonine dehydratase
MPVTFQDIERARQTLKGQVVRTPFMLAHKLSDMTGAQIFVKFENMQVTSSFKDRGAYNKMSGLSAEEKAKGVITMSAGNHAQAVAYHARRLGIPATIVMPETTPSTKVERTRAHGAQIVLSGETLADSEVTARALVAEKGLVLIHPYDDDKIIAGQGTIACEMLEDQPDLDVIIIPIGGGGVMSGCALAAKHLKPDIVMIGAETKLYPSMYHALRGQQSKCGGSTLAEGIAVKNVTERTVAICKQFVDDVRLVGEPDIEQAVMAYLTGERSGLSCVAVISIRAFLPPSSPANCSASSASSICASRSMTGLAYWARSRHSWEARAPISSMSPTAACSLIFQLRGPNST